MYAIFIIILIAFLLSACSSSHPAPTPREVRVVIQTECTFSADHQPSGGYSEACAK